MVFISPKSGEPQVDWRRSQIDIRPKKGWKPNTVYTVTVAAGIMDLRNNSIDSATRIVFSTGGPIPDTKITGVAFDWQVGSRRIEGDRRGDCAAIAPRIRRSPTPSAVTRSNIYRRASGHLRAFVDRNLNRQLEPLEPFDTASVTLTQNANADFYAFSHDSDWFAYCRHDDDRYEY